jgi:hypothetical protein
MVFYFATFFFTVPFLLAVARCGSEVRDVGALFVSLIYCVRIFCLFFSLF